MSMNRLTSQGGRISPQLFGLLLVSYEWQDVVSPSCILFRTILYLVVSQATV